MSRQIDLSKPLSEKDKQYLLQRGREYDVQQNESLTGEPQKVPHTGDVGSVPDTAANGGIQRDQLPVEDTAASAAAAAGMPGIVSEENPGNTTGDSDVLQPPYDREGITKKMLVAEIRRRNALPENAEYEDISASGNNAALAAALVEDDEASE